ncbi:hypothetical protein VFPPC_16662 [Pochonia chlamydosporia 170]|uniref:Uncharacterized protein n=1 Tax=Pochonia chlamydosporia 170 TaxID=1380566 RepID=A0A179FAN5_METCM|nr:hypothetical protein VFPPC_16662 [Pochonia chlamydosporia 170]OAQ62477.1 hypothetical protein VFPPC_16662 [Pochonia chlamydosporia 170]
MTSNTDLLTPRFFYTTQGIQSAIGLHNVLVGFMVAGIVGEVSVLILVPIVGSIAVCVSSALSYYVTFTAVHAPVNQAVAAGFGGLTYLVQEAGLPFYSYVVLKNILCGRERRFFRLLFWVLMLVVFVIHVIHTVLSVGYFLGSPALAMDTIKPLLIVYYLTIAIIEFVSAALLIKNFRKVLGASLSSPLTAGKLYRYLMSSTEIRLATMAFIGIGRTLSTAVETQVGQVGLAGDVDGFIYTVECLFPVVMYIDILASRLIFAHDTNRTGNNFIAEIEERGGSI